MERALRIAQVEGLGETERHLRAHEWRIRSEMKRGVLLDRPLMQHQMYDSHNPTWLQGNLRKKYLCTTSQPDDFAGSHIDAHKRLPPKTPQNRKRYKVLPPMYEHS